MTPRLKFVSFNEEIHSVDALRYWQGGDTEYDEWVNMHDEYEELKRFKQVVDGDDPLI